MVEELEAAKAGQIDLKGVDIQPDDASEYFCTSLVNIRIYTYSRSPCSGSLI